nr:hypothetical protein [Aromatoleum toluvorans]
MLLVEIAAHVSGEQQFPVEIVSPFVVRANQLGGFPVRLAANPGAAMAAGVVEGADFAVSPAHDGDRIISDLERDIVPGFFEFECMRGKYPFLMPDLLQVITICILIAVKLTGKAMTRLALLQETDGLGLIAHF